MKEEADAIVKSDLSLPDSVAGYCLYQSNWHQGVVGFRLLVSKIK